MRLSECYDGKLYGLKEERTTIYYVWVGDVTSSSTNVLCNASKYIYMYYTLA